MRKHWTTLATLIACISTGAIHSQEADNMVYNPSFESYLRCPTHIDAMGVLRDVEAWWQPTAGSSDYFNACGSHECMVPRNKMGIQPAHSGEAYCGIYCSQEHYREYLQTELKSPLQAGHRYHVSFWVSLADKSPQAVATLGALLTTYPVSDSTKGVIMCREVSALDDELGQSIAVYFTPQVVHCDTLVISNTLEWIEVSGEFTAQGGERFLTIGNFNPTQKSKVTATNNHNAVLSGAYYYVDDVSVISIEPDIIPETLLTESPKQDSIVRLGAVYFATGESEVLQQSYRELLHLKQMLKDNPSIRIEIRGHTDNQGTVEFNQKLSEARAKAIADYLIQRGINSKRISWKGFGKSMPIDDNSTPEGRSNNRRVEYRVLGD